MQDPIKRQKLYNFLKDNNLVSSDFETFSNKYKSEESTSQLHQFLSDNKLTDKSQADFHSEYFGDLMAVKNENPHATPGESAQERNHRLLKENVSSYNDLYSDFKQKTSLTEEDTNAIESGLEKDINKEGIWNTIKDGAKKWWNGVFSDEPGVQVSTDPLADAKEKAQKKLSEQGVKEVTPELLTQTAKEIEIEKRKNSLIDSKKRTYLKEISESDKDLLQAYENFEVKSFSRKDKELIQEQTILRKALEEKASELSELNNTAKQYKENNEPIPKELVATYTEKLNKFNEATKIAQEQYLQYANNREELGSAQDNLDLFKRDYDWSTNFIGNVRASTADILGGLAGGIAYVNDFSEIARTGINTDDILSKKMLNISNYFKEDAEKIRGGIMRPISVDNINNMSDFGSWLSNTAVAQQLPILATISTGAGGIGALGLSSTGQKYSEMQNEGGYSTAQLMGVPLAFGTLDTAGAIVDASIFKSAGRVLRSATDTEKRLIARGMFDRIKETTLKAGKDISKGTLSESAEEGGVQFFQNILDKYALGKQDVVLTDGIKDAMAAGSVFGFGMPMGSHIVKNAYQPFAKSKDFNHVISQIEILENQLNNRETVLPEQVKSALENKLAKKKTQLEGIAKTISEDVSKLSNEAYDKIVGLEREKSAIKEDAKAIKEDNSIDDKVKEMLLSDFKKDFEAIEAQQKGLLEQSTDTKKPEGVSDKIWQQNKDEASKILVAEKQKAGEKEFTITDAEISEKANELLNEQAKQENTVQETKPEVLPVETSKVEENKVNEEVDKQEENVNPQVDNETQTQGDTTINQDVRLSTDTNEGQGQNNEVQSATNIEADTKPIEINDLKKDASNLTYEEWLSEQNKWKKYTDILSDKVNNVSEKGVMGLSKRTPEFIEAKKAYDKAFKLYQNFNKSTPKGYGKKKFNDKINKANKKHKEKQVISNNSISQIIKLSEKGKSYTAEFKEGKLLVTDTDGKDVSKPTYRKVRAKYAESVDFTQGKKTEATPNPEFHKNVAETSENPSEIAETLLSIRNNDFVENQVDFKTRVIAENIGEVSRDQFTQFGDENTINQSLAKSYLRKDGKPIDTLAQELSEDHGIEITPQDIVNFMVDNPNGANSVFRNVKNEHFKPLEEKFELLTGLPANDTFLNKAVKQKIKKESLEDAYGLFDAMSEEDFLSLEQRTRDLQNEYYGKTTDKQGNESENATRLSTQNESQSRVREESDGNIGGKITESVKRLFTVNTRKEQASVNERSNNDGNTNDRGRTEPTNSREFQNTRTEKSKLDTTLKDFAQQQNLWLTEQDITKLTSNKLPSGKEATVYLSKDKENVIKVIDYGKYSKTPLDFVTNRIEGFNYLFPETALEIIGFTETDKGVSFVVKQRFIKGKELSKNVNSPNTMLSEQKRINDFISDRFKMKGIGLDAYGNNEYSIEDLHLKNVMEDENGNLYVVDAITTKKKTNTKQSNKVSEQLQKTIDALDQFEKDVDEFFKGNTTAVFIPPPVILGAIKAMKLAVKTAKVGSDIIQAGIDYIKNSDWYKNQITDEKKVKIDEALANQDNFFNSMSTVLDEVKQVEKAKSDLRAQRLKDTTKKLRKQHSELSDYKKALIQYINDKLDAHSFKENTKNNILSLVKKISGVKTLKAADKLVGEIDFKIAKATYKASKRKVDDILKTPKRFLKSVNGKPKANLVDNDTRKLFDLIAENKSKKLVELQKQKAELEQEINNGDVSEKTLNKLIATEASIGIAEAQELLNITKENTKDFEANAERLQLAKTYLDNAFNDFDTFLNEGKYKLKEQIKAEANRLKEINDEFIDATNHKWNDTHENTEKRNALFKKKNNFFNKQFDKLKKVKNWFTRPVTNSFEFLLGFVDQKNNHGEGAVYNRFYKEGIVESDANYKKDKRAIREEVKAELKKILGVNLEWLYNLDRHENKIQKVKDTKIQLLVNGVRETHSQQMSISQALYVHLVSKMPDAKLKLAEQGWDAVALEQLDAFLGEKFLKVSDFMTSYLRGKYDKYNTTFNDLLRTDLGFEEGYFPLKYIDADLRMDVDLAGNNYSLPSVSNGHLKNKVANKNRIDTQVDAFSVFSEYLDSMERFHHYGRFTKDLNAALSNKTVRNNIKTLDETLFSDFKKLSKAVIGDTSEITSGKTEKAIYRANSVLAAGYIGYKGYTALKQFLSMPAYTENANDINIGFNGNKIRIPFVGKLWFGTKMLVNLNPYSVIKSYKFLKKNSPHFYDRIDKGSIGDEFIDNLLSKNQTSFYNKVFKYLVKKGITPNKFIDAITISTGGKVFYDQQFDNYTKAGLDKAEAHRKAIRDFEISFKLTQQSSDASDLSIIQHSKGVLTSLFVPFKNSQFSYFRRISANSNNILRRYKNEKSRLLKLGRKENIASLKALQKIASEGQTFKDLENILLYTHVLPLLWQYVASGLPGLLTDWEDDDTDEMIRAGALGLFDGVFILSDATKWAYNSAFLDKNWNYETSILMSEFQTIFNDVKKVYKEAGEFNEDLLLEIGKGYLKTKSINTETIKNIYDGASEMIMEGDFSQENLMTLLNAPKELRKEEKKENTGYKSIR